MIVYPTRSHFEDYHVPPCDEIKNEKTITNSWVKCSIALSDGRLAAQQLEDFTTICYVWCFGMSVFPGFNEFQSITINQIRDIWMENVATFRCCIRFFWIHKYDRNCHRCFWPIDDWIFFFVRLQWGLCNEWNGAAPGWWLRKKCRAKFNVETRNGFCMLMTVIGGEVYHSIKIYDTLIVHYNNLSK